jgi:hypothetical protein
LEDKTSSIWAWNVGLLGDKTSSVELRDRDFKRIEHEVWALKRGFSFSHTFVLSPLKQ